MDSEEFKKKLLQNPKFKQEWEKFDLLFELEMLWLKIKLWYFSIKKNEMKVQTKTTTEVRKVMKGGEK